MAQDLAVLLQNLGLSPALETLTPHWGASEAAYPAGGPPFLEAAEVARHHAFAGLPEEVLAPLQKTARRVRENPCLAHLAWHCYRLLFHCPDYEGEKVAQWPPLPAALGDLHGLFYLLVALAVIPLVEETHRALGLPAQVTRETCSHFPALLAHYRNAHGGLGVLVRVLYWLRHHTAGDLFRLGRMEYMVRPFAGQLEAYRHRRTGRVVALAADGLAFAPDGFLPEAGGPQPPGGWTARLVKSTQSVTGTPLSPTGVGLRQELSLSLSDWRRVLAPGDPILDTHIPGGGGMGPEACHDTMRQALEFFPRYFPERPFAGFACISWILNPELEQIYSPSNNMTLWQRELYLFPFPSGKRAGLFFVFGVDDLDPATAPRDTTLRRALVEHLERGGRLLHGGMFFLQEDFPHFGTQVYRSHFPAPLAEETG